MRGRERGGGRERERQRQTDRQTNRQRQRERREGVEWGWWDLAGENAKGLTFSWT